MEPLEFWETPLQFNAEAYRDILILGLGGGCDIISAYVAQFLFPFASTARIRYGNTKKKLDSDFELLSPNIGRLPLGPRARGIPITTKIDQMVPRGPDSCPYIVKCRSKTVPLLPHEISQLQPDLIIGVDAGGDALIEGAISGPAGQDKIMVEVLKKADPPFLLLILGPGCDGESYHEQILAAFNAEQERGKFLGALSMGPLIPHFEPLTASLSSSRTPNIILSALKGELSQDVGGNYFIPRGICAYLPPGWLTHAFAFG